MAMYLPGAAGVLVEPDHLHQIGAVLGSQIVEARRVALSLGYGQKVVVNVRTLHEVHLVEEKASTSVIVCVRVVFSCLI